jgi:hypothetical protein
MVGMVRYPEVHARVWLWKYDMNVQVGRCQVPGLWYISNPAHDVAVVAEAQRNPFISARLLLIFLGRNMYSCFEI